MNLAVMQPYLLPYIGYFQLINAVDSFVFLDDVAYIKRGWVNRNRILQNNMVRYLTVPLSRASQNRRINEILIEGEFQWREDIIRSIHHAYRRAPEYARVMLLLERIFGADIMSISELAKRSVKEISSYLGLPTAFQWTSSSLAPPTPDPTARIIDICTSVGATVYVNLPGGVGLYRPAAFANRGVELCFCSPVLSVYPQNSSQFVPALSIVDVLMNCARGVVQEMVREGRIYRAQDAIAESPTSSKSVGFE